MHNEVEHLQHTVTEQLEQVMKLVSSSSKEELMPKLPSLKRTGGGGKMSIEDKQKLKEMTENFDRV